MARKPRLPAKPPKDPPKPLMRFARPAMRTLVSRLENMLRADEIADIAELLQRSRAWPTSALHRSKEEVIEIRELAGALVMEFNRKHSDRDGEDFIKFG